MKQYYCPRCKEYFPKDEVEFIPNSKAKIHWWVDEDDNKIMHQVMGQEEDAERLAREAAGD